MTRYVGIRTFLAVVISGLPLLAWAQDGPHGWADPFPSPGFSQDTYVVPVESPAEPVEAPRSGGLRTQIQGWWKSRQEPTPAGPLDGPAAMSDDSSMYPDTSAGIEQPPATWLDRLRQRRLARLERQVEQLRGHEVVDPNQIPAALIEDGAPRAPADLELDIDLGEMEQPSLELPGHSMQPLTGAPQGASAQEPPTNLYFELPSVEEPTQPSLSARDRFRSWLPHPAAE